ncbi:MAG: class I SAM-dependent methyltransferase [Clostridiales bacterium]|nr:class I SAM-dependent methyltransferase [Clostridiales bacterium]
MSEQPWQVRLAAKSIKKKDKLRLLEMSLPFLPSRVALDLGCGQGTLSYFVRQKGGFWVSADEDMANLKEAQGLLGSGVIQLTGGHLPFKDRAFDLALCLDYLEHVEADDRALRELARVLKNGGETILVTPHTGKFFFLHKLRSALGLKLEDFGHKREGYATRDLEDKLKRAGLRTARKVTYSRFFSEFLELILNAIYIKVLARKPVEKKRDGHIRPSSGEEFKAQQKTFALYSLVYPLVWLFSRLDKLLFFLPGYSLMVWARKL